MSAPKHINRFCYGVLCVLCIALMGCGTQVQPDHNQSAPAAEFDSPIYSFTLKNIDGWPIALSRYHGKVILVVNVASECRFTHQYENLQRLYWRYRNQGFVVLGFPSNDFGNQERGTNAEIKEFVTDLYNIRFHLFAKISVAGDNMHPLYQCLTSPEANGEFAGPITWNFNKFLIDRDGNTIARFASETDPLDPKIIEAIEAAL